MAGSRAAKIPTLGAANLFFQGHPPRWRPNLLRRYQVLRRGGIKAAARSAAQGEA